MISPSPSTPMLVYDGECPLCARYVSMVRLREAVGDLTLKDARKHPELVADLRDRGFDIEDGMVLFFNGTIHHGHRALVVMASLTTRSSAFNKLNAWLFSSETRSKRIYPFMVAGRNLLLRLLGRTRIA